MLPKDSTCETTQSYSQMPELDWSGIPAGTKSLAMVFIDTSILATNMTDSKGLHSAMWNIPATVNKLPAGLPHGSPPMGVAGLENVKQASPLTPPGWLGPCPNFGSTGAKKTDNYAFELYAFSQDLNITSTNVAQIIPMIRQMQSLGKAVLTAKSDAQGSALK